MSLRSSSGESYSGQITSSGGFSEGYEAGSAFDPPIVGYHTVEESFITFTRYFSVTAYDLPTFKEKKELLELWKTQVISTGSGGDLRRTFPVMIAASKSYLGQNTGKFVDIKISESDQSVSQIKGEVVKK